MVPCRVLDPAGTAIEWKRNFDMEDTGMEWKILKIYTHAFAY